MMKRIIYNTWITVSVLLLASCYKMDDAVFDTSSSERVEADLVEYRSILLDAPYGWIMEYYPEKEERSMGGVVFCSRFSGDTAYLSLETGIRYDGKVISAGTVVPSLFQLKVEQGVVLSFNTYNPLLHLFGTPASQDDTDGYAGDYEFVVRDATAKSITLTGKKWKNVCRLIKLEEPAADYLKKAIEMDEAVEALCGDIIKITAGNTSYPASLSAGFSGRQMSVTFQKPDGADSVVTVAWIPTANSMKLYEPIKINGIEVEEFVVNEEKSKIVAKSNDQIYFEGATTVAEKAVYLRNYMLMNRMNPALLAIYQKAAETNSDEYAETVSRIAIGKNALYPVDDGYPQALVIRSGDYSVVFGMAIAFVEGVDNQINLVYRGLGFNAKFYLWFEPFTTYICDHSPYVLSEDGENICWTSKDGEVVFYTASHL